MKTTSFEFLEKEAAKIVDQTNRSLPAALREHVMEVIVILEPHPDDELIAAGFEPDILGLFDGPDLATDNDGDFAGPRVFLYLENIWDFAEASPELYRKEVRLTYLHELGHFFGWDEDDLDERGLS